MSRRTRPATSSTSTAAPASTWGRSRPSQRAGQPDQPSGSPSAAASFTSPKPSRARGSSASSAYPPKESAAPATATASRPRLAGAQRGAGQAEPAAERGGADQRVGEPQAATSATTSTSPVAPTSSNAGSAGSAPRRRRARRTPAPPTGDATRRGAPTPGRARDARGAAIDRPPVRRPPASAPSSAAPVTNRADTSRDVTAGPAPGCPVHLVGAGAFGGHHHRHAGHDDRASRAAPGGDRLGDEQRAERHGDRRIHVRVRGDEGDRRLGSSQTYAVKATSEPATIRYAIAAQDRPVTSAGKAVQLTTTAPVTASAAAPATIS